MALLPLTTVSRATPPPRTLLPTFVTESQSWSAIVWILLDGVSRAVGGERAGKSCVSAMDRCSQNDRLVESRTVERTSRFHLLQDENMCRAVFDVGEISGLSWISRPVTPRRSWPGPPRPRKVCGWSGACGGTVCSLNGFSGVHHCG
jgi:hypothetical protein